jgi:hypothetical protein
MLDAKLLEEQQNLLPGDDEDSELLPRKGRRRNCRTVVLVALGLLTGFVVGTLIGFMFFTGSKEACLRSVISGCKCCRNTLTLRLMHLFSAAPRRSRHLLRNGDIQRISDERECVSAQGWPRS